VISDGICEIDCKPLKSKEILIYFILKNGESGEAINTIGASVEEW